ncbi:DUF4135 domain-containing protein [Butyrivibrio sp. X503]|uniref:DUF4135 domain-containing protein n=1 Tax=Butyrivibrio sp. X503 TaxID=2364878 RepID=UPI000EA9E87A|nr:DUF4135 domain-containing protein [Butyrivibrio sp. X503]RKM58068.1 DUF4135 domain-containing protein [Butyrivibrio sp. X503]
MQKDESTVKEKYMFESIYESLAKEKLRNFYKDVCVLTSRYEETGGECVNIRRIKRQFKEYLKGEIRDISQSLLITDINEQRSGVLEFWDLNPDSQYKQYIDRFFEKYYYERFIAKYKLWYEKVHRTMDLAYAYLLGVIKNYLTDINKLVKKGLVKEAEKTILSEVEFIGDKRNSGKCTVRCKINEDYVIYKPESGRIFELYGKLIRLVSADDDYKILNMVQGNKYFWAEHLDNDNCDKESEIKEFYKNAGYMLAAAYLMNAVGISEEKIYSVGKYPVMVDAETISSMNLFSKKMTKGKKLFDRSVFKTAIIPMHYSRENKDIIEHNALGDVIFVARSESDITDEFTSKAKERWEVRKYKGKHTHLPKLSGESVPVWEYVDDVIEGFDEGYDNIMDSLPAIYKLLKDYENTKIRISLRNREFYSQMLKKLNSPELLKDKETTQDYIKLVFTDSSIDEYSLKHEIQQLMRGDVPYFTTLLKDRTVYTQEWDRALKRRYESPLECIINKLDDFSKEDKEKQIDFIRSAFDYDHCSLAYFDNDKNIESVVNEWIL